MLFQLLVPKNFIDRWHFVVENFGVCNESNCLVE